MDNMNEKYQQYYSQIVSTTLTDVLVKGIQYQANIKLANDIIEEQEKTIKELRETVETIRKQKIELDAEKVVAMEKTITHQNETIERLMIDLGELNGLKAQYEGVKHLTQHVDTFRNELQKTREILEKERDEHKSAINKLNEEIDYLKLSPAKRKKVDAERENVDTFVNNDDGFEPAVEVTPVAPVKTKARIIKQDLPSTVLLKDGGNF